MSRFTSMASWRTPTGSQRGSGTSPTPTRAPPRIGSASVPRPDSCLGRPALCQQMMGMGITLMTSRSVPLFQQPALQQAHQQPAHLLNRQQPAHLLNRQQPAHLPNRQQAHQPTRVASLRVVVRKRLERQRPCRLRERRRPRVSSPAEQWRFWPSPSSSRLLFVEVGYRDAA